MTTTHKVRCPRNRRSRHQARYRFTKRDCQRGYQAALAKCMEDWDLAAWFFRRLRKHYSNKEGTP